LNPVVRAGFSTPIERTRLLNEFNRQLMTLARQ